MKKRIVLLTGAPGVGKTETARKIIENCPPNSAWIDTDKVAAIHPFRIDEAFYRLLYKNLNNSIQNYKEWGAEIIIISGVLLPSNILSELLKASLGYHWHIYGLVTDEAVLSQRIRTDNKGQDTDQRLSWTHLLEETKLLPNAKVINNTKLTIEETANMILEMEGLGRKKEATLETKQVPYHEILEVANQALLKVGVAEEVAKKVVEDLAESDLAGYFSHGLIRLADYIGDIKRKNLMADRRPSVTSISTMASLVDGNRSFGIFSRRCITETLLDILKREPIAVVGLKNSNHMGRLYPLASSLCAQGYLILGFVNYLGAGQKVPFWGGKEGRFCTNPLVLAVPRSEQAPIIVDISTSAVSEGKIREYAINQQKIPEGWLIDDNWRPITDPQKLYTNPAEAFIAPLGGAQAYKGSGLALLVDVLAGIITGAGFSSPQNSVGGNGGLFVAMRLDILGLDPNQILANIEALVEYCKASPLVDPASEIRIPGEHSHERSKGINLNTEIAYPEKIWQLVQKGISMF